MPGLDPYNMTDKLDDALLEVIGTRLERRGEHPRFIKMMTDYLDAMHIDDAATVLDLGCGTGVAARAIARRPGFGGRLVGIDLSPTLIAQASHHSEAEGLQDRVCFQTGDIHSLTFPDESFDAVVAHTLFSHVNDPTAALAEARRVLREDGLLGAFDGDYASLTFEVGDEAAGKENDEKVISAVITQPRVMRRMPLLARAAGFEIIETFSYVLTEIGKADFWMPAIQSFKKLILKAGVMSEAEAESWTEDLIKASDDGVFFGSSNFYSYVLRKT